MNINRYLPCHTPLLHIHYGELTYFKEMEDVLCTPTIHTIHITKIVISLNMIYKHNTNNMYPAEQVNPYDQNRQFQLPIFSGAGNRQLERRVNELEQRVRQLENTVERHTRRLNRLNQRLRTIENRLNIPFSALEDGF